MLTFKDRFFMKLRHISFLSPERGQSLVEMTVVVPLLLFMFLGLIEVGWAIRGYLVLLSTNREAVRFAARGEYLDFGGVLEGATTAAEVEARVGYNWIKGHAGEVLASNQLGLEPDSQGNVLLQPLDDATKGAYMLTHAFVDTGWPCDPKSLSSGQTCLQSSSGSCSNPADRRPDYPYDDLILVPSRTGYEHFFYAIPYSSTYATRIDLDAEIQKLKAENDTLNCEIQRRDPTNTNPTFSVNSMVIGEAFFDQPQLLGFPFFQFAGSEVPLYNQTMMRITSDSLPQGGGCEALPVAIHEDNLYTDAPTNTNLKALGTPLDDIRNGDNGGNFGWLTWRDGQSVDPGVNGNSNSQQYLSAAINNTRISFYDYQNPLNTSDTVLNADDWVKGYTGQVTSAANQAMTNRLNRVVTIPVWDTTVGGGQNKRFHIVGFAKVRITDINFQGNPKSISGVFMGWDNDCFNTSQTSW